MRSGAKTKSKAKIKANRTVTLFLGNREEYEKLLIGDGSPHLKKIIQIAGSQGLVHASRPIGSVTDGWKPSKKREYDKALM